MYILFLILSSFLHINLVWSQSQQTSPGVSLMIQLLPITLLVFLIIFLVPKWRNTIMGKISRVFLITIGVLLIFGLIKDYHDRWWLWTIGAICIYFFFYLPYSKTDKDKKCAWCDARKIIFQSGIKGDWYWQYRNTDGSQDKRVKDNFQQANFTSEYLCENCGAVTTFIHFVNKEPSENVKVSQRLLKSGGKGERKGSDWKSSSGVNVDASSANRKSK